MPDLQVHGVHDVHGLNTVNTMNKEKDLFGFSYAEIDGIEGFWIKPSERNSLPYEQIEAMMEALRPNNELE